ncbi:hypothetical protein ACHHYP_02989 [Achlya hypogyna]|uniref:Hs1pro-1 C-terminal domain-containing protein n=1 Tax=Achlya hypogyna TaxID=1202772 RepID=A0A1V9Z4Y2_ACHHY|nr:hypothetical protein ACHHYP_02989 [Achlya hypogyna]
MSTDGYGATHMPPAAEVLASAPPVPPGRLSSSATTSAYAAYLTSLHHNAYASYIRLEQLERVWGLWALRSPSIPFDTAPLHELMSPGAFAAVSGPLYRVAPALSAIEITLRLGLDLAEIASGRIQEVPPATPPRHRNYVFQSTRRDAVLRNLTMQLGMVRTLLELDLEGTSDLANNYQLVDHPSNESLAAADGWWWQHSGASASYMQNLLLSSFVGLPFGSGMQPTGVSGQLYLPYDALVQPLYVRRKCVECDDPEAFPEDHFFATVHQITEAWCCVLERQLDRAQELLDEMALDTDPRPLVEGAARRYRYCTHIWEYLIDHISILSEMDCADYLTLKLHLHGASGGQSVRLRQLSRRIPHLLPLELPLAIGPIQGPFDPTSLSHVLRVLATIRVGDTGDDIAAVAQLQAMYAAHVSPAADFVQLLQAIQMLENAVRRFYFGHQQLAIMVLGASAAGTGSPGKQDFTVNMLERGWKNARRYVCCERAKVHLSEALDARQLDENAASKGRIIRLHYNETIARVERDKLNAVETDRRVASQPMSTSPKSCHRPAELPH